MCLSRRAAGKNEPREKKTRQKWGAQREDDDNMGRKHPTVCF